MDNIVVYNDELKVFAFNKIFFNKFKGITCYNFLNIPFPPLNNVPKKGSSI